MSYINTLMYSSAMPMIGDMPKGDDKKPDFDESLDACNPDNFTDFEEFEIVRV